MWEFSLSMGRAGHNRYPRAETGASREYRQACERSWNKIRPLRTCAGARIERTIVRQATLLRGLKRYSKVLPKGRGRCDWHLSDQHGRRNLSPPTNYLALLQLWHSPIMSTASPDAAEWAPRRAVAFEDKPDEPPVSLLSPSYRRGGREEDAEQLSVGAVRAAPSLQL